MPNLSNNRTNSAYKFLLSTLLLLCCHVCTADVSEYKFHLLESLSHNTNSFTQGLVVDKEHIIESSGLFKKSFLQRYPKAAISDIPPSQRVELSPKIFAEGIAVIEDNLFLLTWKAGIAIQFNKNTLQVLKQFHYQGEGWGLTSMDQQLIMSNGSNKLTLRDSATFKPLKTLTVTHPSRQIDQLNDLTYGMGLIWANVWQENHILAIDPHSGQVVGQLTLSKISRINKGEAPTNNVLNGLAWDEHRQALWVTGKRWPQRYLIRPIISSR